MKTKFTTITIFILFVFGNAVFAKQRNDEIKKLQFLKTNRISLEKGVHKNFFEVPKLTEIEFSVPGYSEDYSWDMELSSWQHVANTTYTYNEKGKVIEEIVQDAATDIYLSRISYSYDDFGNLTEEVSYNMGFDEWIVVSGDKTIYSYTNGNISEEITQTWENGNWENKTKTYYTLNENGIPTEFHYDIWDGSDWQQNSRTVLLVWHNWEKMQPQSYIVHYYEDGKPSERYSFEYEGNNYTGTIELGSNSEWVNSKRESYSKSATEEVLVVLEWSEAGWELAENYRTTFDFLGNQTEFHFSTWNGASWFIEMEFFFDLTYSESIDVAEMVVRYSDPDVEEPVNISKYLFSSFLHFITTDIPEVNILENVKVFPNPVTSTFHIQLGENSAAKYQVNIVNLAGQTVFSNIYSDPSIKINTEGFTTGMYLLNIKTDDGRFYNSKLLKN